FEDVSGYQLFFGGKLRSTFPINMVIPGLGFLVIAKSPANLRAVYGTTNGLANVLTYSGSLNNFDDISLANKQGAILLDVPYPDLTANPVLVATEGAGHSLVLAQPSFGEGNSRAWGISDVVGGSPGWFEPAGVEPLRPVMLNEFYAPRDQSSSDFVELYNHS